MKIADLKNVEPGDLVRVEWYDASIGRSISMPGREDVDIPVKSWGVFLAILGKERKHIVLAQNSFQYTNTLFDVDYTSIPLAWTVNLKIVNKGEIDRESAEILLRSFLSGRRRTIKRRKENSGKMD